MSDVDLYTQLERLKQLHSNGALSDEEFNSMKGDILVSLAAKRTALSTQSAVGPAKRSVWKRIGWCLVWVCVFFVSSQSLVVIAVIASNPDISDVRMDELNVPIVGGCLLISLIASIILTAAGALPGTKRPV